MSDPSHNPDCRCKACGHGLGCKCDPVCKALCLLARHAEPAKLRSVVPVSAASAWLGTSVGPGFKRTITLAVEAPSEPTVFCHVTAATALELGKQLLVLAAALARCPFCGHGLSEKSGEK